MYLAARMWKLTRYVTNIIKPMLHSDTTKTIAIHQIGMWRWSMRGLSEGYAPNTVELAVVLDIFYF